MDSRKVKTDAFENVKDQIGYCGIWCGSCVVGNGVLRKLTNEYERLIKDYGLAEWAPQDFDFSEFTKGLASIKAMPLCPGCLKGGGRDNCEMKACATKKNINDCSECGEPELCKHKKILECMRTGALKAGLFLKTGKVDRKKLLTRWCIELRKKWPGSVLFHRTARKAHS